MELIIENINMVLLCMSAISTVLMLVVAAKSKEVAKRSAETQKAMFDLQQKYNIVSMRPKCDIVCSEAGGIIKISLYNYGQGTMTINRLEITNKETGSVLHNAYEIIPENIGISYYSLDTEGRYIRVGGHIKLIEIDTNKLDAEEYERVRRALAKYTIAVYYTGVYEQDIEVDEKKDLAKLFGNVYRNSGAKTRKNLS